MFHHHHPAPNHKKPMNRLPGGLSTASAEACRLQQISTFFWSKKDANKRHKKDEDEDNEDDDCRILKMVKLYLIYFAILEIKQDPHFGSI